MITPGTVMEHPSVYPNDWFTTAPAGFDPVNDLSQPVTWIEPSGRYAQLVAPYDRCLLNGSSECWTAPLSQTGYALAHGGGMWPTDTGMVPAALFAMGLPHADDSWAGKAKERQQLFSNTQFAVAAATIVDLPEMGGVFAFGCVLPGVSLDRLLIMQATGVSGEWGPVAGLPERELYTAQFVNTLGYRRDAPKVKQGRRRMVAAAAGEMLVTSWEDQQGVTEMSESTTGAPCACQIKPVESVVTAGLSVTDVQALISAALDADRAAWVAAVDTAMGDMPVDAPMDMPATSAGVDEVTARVATLEGEVASLRSDVAELVALIAAIDSEMGMAPVG